MMTLLRQALTGFGEEVVPTVYGWSAAGEQRGWALMEFMPGEPLGEAFPKLGPEEQKGLIQ